MTKYSKEKILGGIFIIIFLLMTILAPSKFISVANLQSMAFQLPEFGILSLAMMVVIVSGGINLSLVSVASLSGIMSAFTLAGLSASGTPVWLTIVAAIAVSIIVALLCGTLNGFVIAIIGVSPILVTLGSMTLFDGISFNFTRGGPVSGFPEAFSWFGNSTVLGMPVPMIFFILVIIATIILLEHTPWGFSLYMTGCNSTATMYSGINVKKVLFFAYLYSAYLGSIAAILMSSRYNSAKVDYGASYTMQSIAAAVLGGTDIAGGSGKVIGTVIAAGILQVVSSGFNLIGVDRNISDMTFGIILIVVLAFNQLNLKGFQLKPTKA